MSIILLVGKAGSGKSEVARILSEDFDAAVVAHAAPMKEFVGNAFGFSFEQLWGPSESRNAVDTRFVPVSFMSEDPVREQAASYVAEHGRAWVADVLPDLTETARSRAFGALCDWAAWVLDLDQITPRRVLQTLGTEWGRTHGGADMWSRYALRRANQALVGGSPLAVIADGRFRNEVVNALSQAWCVRIHGAETTMTHASEQEVADMPDHWFDAELMNDHSAGLDALQATVHLMMRGLVQPAWRYHV